MLSKIRNSFARGVENIQAMPLGGWKGIIILVGIIALRDILESISSVGFVIPSKDLLSFGIQNASYLVWGTLVVHLTVGERIEKVFKLGLAALTVLFIPPIVDLIAFGPAGRHMLVVMNYSPSVSLIAAIKQHIFYLYSGLRTTGGHFFQMHFIFILIALYLFLYRKGSWLRRIAAFVALFFVLLFINGYAFFVPYLCNLVRHIPLGIFQLSENSYVLLYILDGIALLVMLLTYFNWSVVKCWKYLFGFPSLHYYVMLTAGIMVSFNNESAWFSVMGWSRVLLIYLIPTSFWVAVRIYNHISDREADRLNGKRNLISDGFLSKQEALTIAYIAIFFGSVGSLYFDYRLFLVNLTLLIFGWLYSDPGLKVRSFPFVGNLIIGLNSVLTFLLGYISGMDIPARSLTELPVGIATIIFCSFTIMSILKDEKDITGDTRSGYFNLYSKYAPRKINYILCGVATGLYGVMPALMSLSLKLELAITLAVISFVWLANFTVLSKNLYRVMMVIFWIYLSILYLTKAKFIL